jgi:hypothetical protein
VEGGRAGGGGGGTDIIKPQEQHRLSKGLVS